MGIENWALLTVLVLAPVIVVIVFLLWVVKSTRRKTKWGYNLGTVTCPRCKAAQPTFRWPRSARQALWGGFTCLCGCEMDKWGNEIFSTSPPR